MREAAGRGGAVRKPGDLLPGAFVGPRVMLWLSGLCSPHLRGFPWLVPFLFPSPAFFPALTPDLSSAGVFGLCPTVRMETPGERGLPPVWMAVSPALDTSDVTECGLHPLSVGELLKMLTRSGVGSHEYTRVLGRAV